MPLPQSVAAHAFYLYLDSWHVTLEKLEAAGISRVDFTLNCTCTCTDLYRVCPSCTVEDEELRAQYPNQKTRIPVMARRAHNRRVRIIEDHPNAEAMPSVEALTKWLNTAQANRERAVTIRAQVRALAADLT